MGDFIIFRGGNKRAPRISARANVKGDGYCHPQNLIFKQIFRGENKGKREFLLELYSDWFLCLREVNMIFAMAIERMVTMFTQPFIPKWFRQSFVPNCLEQTVLFWTIFKIKNLKFGAESFGLGRVWVPTLVPAIRNYFKKLKRAHVLSQSLDTHMPSQPCSYSHPHPGRQRARMWTWFSPKRERKL